MNSKYNMTQQENIFFVKRNVVDYIWKSANLEGIGVTYPDTQAIYNGMSVSGYSIEDINAVNDLKHAWAYLIEHINDELNVEFIKSVHRLLGRFTVINAGALRRDEVRIGGTDWIPDIPVEENIEKELKEILEKDSEPTEKALDVTLLSLIHI